MQTFALRSGRKDIIRVLTPFFLLPSSIFIFLRFFLACFPFWYVSTNDAANVGECDERKFSTEISPLKRATRSVLLHRLDINERTLKGYRAKDAREEQRAIPDRSDSLGPSVLVLLLLLLPPPSPLFSPSILFLPGTPVASLSAGV